MHDPHPYIESSENLIIVNYDEGFVKAIDLFHDNVAGVFKSLGYTGDIQPHVFFGQVLLVELLIDKLRGVFDYEEVVAESIFDTFNEDIAQSLIDELTSWINSNVYPFGLVDIVRGLSPHSYLIDISFDEDNDATYYSFDGE